MFYFMAVFSILLSSCDPSGGPSIVSKYEHKIRVSITYEHNGDVHKSAVVLEPNMVYFPGARHVDQRNIIEIKVETIDGKELWLLSNKEIAAWKYSESDKSNGLWIISENGVTLEAPKE